MLRYVLLFFAVLLAQPVRANIMLSGATLTAPGATPVAVPPDLPERLLKQMNKAKSKFLEDAAALILGYGTVDGIGPAGIEHFIASSRAEIRARAMARLLAGDLDNDGAVSGEELASLVANASATGRGRLQLSFTLADADQAGFVTAAELRAFGQTKALDLFDEAEANDWRQFMLFDLDGNGHVALPEVMEVVSMLKQAG